MGAGMLDTCLDAWQDVLEKGTHGGVALGGTCARRGEQVVQRQKQRGRVGQIGLLNNKLARDLAPGLLVAISEQGWVGWVGLGWVSAGVGSWGRGAGWGLSKLLSALFLVPATRSSVQSWLCSKHPYLFPEDLLARDPAVDVHEVQPVRNDVHREHRVPARH